MTIPLITGTPGAGKTLFAVSEVLKPLVGTTIDYDGRKIERRLMIGGIPDLLLPHEPVDMPDVQRSDYKDEWTGRERKPGEPPHDVPHRGDNWWLWCMPGDYIVLDECQRLMRPAAAGKAVPWYISKLETHRHYGVDILLITQHPQLLHANVRNLVGQHRHVRRLVGGGNTLVYEWDHCTHPDKVKTAATRYWRHKGAAFGLYKSAEVHTKTTHTKGAAVIVLLAMVVILPATLWMAYDRMWARKRQPAAEAAIEAPVEAASQPQPVPQPMGQARVQAPGLGASAPARFPMTDPEPRTPREPYAWRGFVLDGSVGDGAAKLVYFGVVIDGRRVHTVTLHQLVRAGYTWTDHGPCAGLLERDGQQRLVTCGHAAAAPGVPAAAASSPVV